MNREGVLSVLNLLIAKKMSGKENVLQALKDYAEGMSLREASINRGVSFFTLRSLALRIDLKVGDRVVSKKFLSDVIPVVIRSVEIVIRYERRPVCMICGREIRSDAHSPEDHLLKNHLDVIERVREKIIEELKRKIEAVAR
jgi:lambda repressor-like predicted transcriptional regulator